MESDFSDDDDAFEFQDTREFDMPLSLGSLVIRNLQEYEISRELIFDSIRKLEDYDFMIDDLEELLVDNYDMGEVTALFRDIMGVQPQIIDATAMENIRSNIGSISNAQESILEIQDGMAQAIAELADEYNLDDLVNLNETSVFVPDYEPSCYRTIRPTPSSGPPRPPNYYNGIAPPVSLIISSEYNSVLRKLRRTGTWSEFLEITSGGKVRIPRDSCWPDDQEAVDERVSSAYSVYSNGATHSKSNSRPRGSPVYILDALGNYINCGTHSIPHLYNDLVIPLKASCIKEALSEFYAARAGEGLSCPTPSQELHQAVSAVLSAMIELGSTGYEVAVEQGPDDILLISNYDRTSVGLDITTSAGIHSKPLNKKPMIALSKYDLGACFSRSGDYDSSRAFCLLIANCLATEHPSFYGAFDEKDMSSTLKVHRQISRVVSVFSQATLSELCHMSYDAIMEISTNAAKELDLKKQGISFKAKADTLLTKVKEIAFPAKCAIPPYPCSKIIPLEGGSHTLNICGVEVKAYDLRLSPLIDSEGFETIDSEKFLLDFPACGIVPGSEALEIIKVIDNQLLASEGMTHEGPFPKARPGEPDSEIWNLCSKIYATSSVAQFAEIRADLVKTIDLLPRPGDNKWRQIPLYKNKVICWYRIRDSITDARGYRVDWFAISSFDVVGSHVVRSKEGVHFYLWPRQRLRSQEMELAGTLPRRLKITLFSMLEKHQVVKASLESIILAWQRLAITATSSTWATGRNLISARYLSSSFSSPSSPFDKWTKKLVAPKTFPEVLFMYRLRLALENWHERDQYFKQCPMLGVPRQMSQLEAYWKVWVPNEHADSNKNFTDCVYSLWEESELLEETKELRWADATDQLDILLQSEISYSDILTSIQQTDSLEMGGKLGWSVFGSLGAAYALSLSGDPRQFDKAFSRGKKARRLVDSLTVRHSARVDNKKELVSGTVAELILDSGVDNFLSDLEPTFRFFYGHGAYYFNHDKKGELKEREISIAEPDARIMLNKAELIAGAYGKTTSIDMLKRPDKDSHFYRVSSQAMEHGGCIQSSDASRFSAMMSNAAIAILCYGLGALGGSAHLRGAGAIYNCLSARKMLITSNVVAEIDKRLAQDRSVRDLDNLRKFKKWVTSGQVVAYQKTKPVYCYTTDTHCGQGMSHHGMSLMHGGGLLISINSAKTAIIRVRGKKIPVDCVGLVTSDDSTLVTMPHHDKTSDHSLFSRRECQQACRMFLYIQNLARITPLKLVSVLANDAKEQLSGICGEFNSQDNGMGIACPILGWREMICELIRPSSPSLIGDYLNAYAYAQSVAFRGQGLSCGIYAHHMALDAIQARWRFTEDEINFIESCEMIPNALKNGAAMDTLLCKPQALMPHHIRCALLQIAMNYNAKTEDLDPHTRDTVFGPMMHVKTGMPQMHKRALLVMDRKIRKLKELGMVHQAAMMEEAKYATVASGRSRGLGRIGQRIRSRMVHPKEYLGYEFQRGPMLESTLTWIAHLSTLINSINVDIEVKNSGILLGEKVHVKKVMHFNFPRPITKRRQSRRTLQKPTFVLQNFGLTPFGRHSIIRSQAIIVPEIGPDQRKLMQNYLLGKYVSNVTEHTLYGNTFVTSWTTRQAGVVATEPLGHATLSSIGDRTLWGSMDERSIQLLQSMEESYTGKPILALNYASGGMGHFHTVHKGIPISVSVPFDPEHSAPGDHLHHMAPGGVSVVCVNQGFTTTRDWHGTAPTPLEIELFQTREAGPYPNFSIEALSQELEQSSSLIVPTAAVKVEHNGKSCVLSMSRRMTRNCSQRWLAHERSKMVGELAMGGYWYSAVKGVSFRAFLKGHCAYDNIWTGAVLGWRRNLSSAPTYQWEPPPGRSLKTLAMIGGIDDDNHISSFDISTLATGHVYVDYNGSHSVDEFINMEFSSHVAALMRCVNGGDPLFNSAGRPALLLDSMIPPPITPMLNIGSEEAKSQLLDMAFGQYEAMDLW